MRPIAATLATLALATPAAADPALTSGTVDVAVERCLPAIMGGAKADHTGMEKLGTQFQLVYMRGQPGAAWGAPVPGVVMLAYDAAPVCQVLALWAEPEAMLAALGGKLEAQGFEKTRELSGAEGWRTDWTATRDDGTPVTLIATALPKPPGAPEPQAVLTVFEGEEQ